MADIIQLLPDSVANQIAAGEVIQRPASVIKELVENALDAGATKINIIVVDAGRTCIQVIDNGRGMSETDARLSFERHATSKIRKADDLFALRSMGFRGEALASIAAVAQVELLTRTASEEVGTQINISGSKVLSQEPAACPVGSNFKVENLFFNVPARRKFLKSNATELSNILTAVERIALAYPDIHFTLHHNGAELLNLKPGPLRQRITDMLGKQLATELLPVDVKTAICSIHGFVTKPQAARKKAGADYFFVNGRYMRHPYFHKAVITAYERLIAEGMQPPYMLYFDVEPGDIDVNIHPTKTEIKFENEQAIFQILLAGVRDAIGRFCEIPTIDFDTTGRPEIPVFTSGQDFVAPPKVQYNPSYNPFDAPHASRQPKVPSEWESLYEGLDDSDTAPLPETAAPDDGPDLFSQSPDMLGQSPDLFSQGTGTLGQSPVEPLEKSPLHYQYKGRYIMTAVKSGLMVIDQQRASLRILYDKYLEQQQSRAVGTQKLLFPETIQFTANEAVIFASVQPVLSALGFDLADLGGNTWAVNGIPTGIEGLDPVALLRSMLADAVEKGSVSAGEIHATVALSLARSAAVPYGQVLNNEEMENLLNQLFSCTNVNYTPDGKTILYILPQQDIERMF